MRILYWSELFWPYIGGIEIFSANLIKSLRKHGHEFTIVTSQSNLELADQEEFEGGRIFRFPFRRAFETRDTDLYMRLQRRIAELKQTYQPDLIHINAASSSVILHFQTVRAHSSPTLVTLHTELLTGSNDAGSTLTGLLLRSANWVNAVSTVVLTQARRLVPAITSRSSVVHNGLQAPSVPPTPIPFSPPQLLCTGRFTREKGFDLALTALRSINGRFSNVGLVLAGDGPERKHLERQVDELNLGEDVKFMGWVNPDEIPGLINRATAVLMPSRIEGLPLVALQAAIMGRPIVATRVGGIPEVVIDGETGFLVEPEDATGLAARVCYLLNHPMLAVRMGEIGRCRVRTLFGWDKCADAYAHLYRQVVEQRAGGSA